MASSQQQNNEELVMMVAGETDKTTTTTTTTTTVVTNRNGKSKGLRRIRCDVVTSFGDEKTLICFVGNCVARSAMCGSLLSRISEIYPYANPYPLRKRSAHPNLAEKDSRPRQGAVLIIKPPTGATNPIFAFLFAQYRAGVINADYFLDAEYVDDDYVMNCLEEDDYECRVYSFRVCIGNLLNALETDTYKNINRIVFVKTMEVKEWKDYIPIISSFANTVIEKNKEIEVVLATQKSQATPERKKKKRN